MSTEGKKSTFKGGTFEEIFDHVVFNLRTGSTVSPEKGPLPEEDERFYFLVSYREFKTCYDLFDLWSKKYIQFKSNEEKSHALVTFLNYWINYFYEDDFERVGNKGLLPIALKFANTNLPKEESNKIKLLFVRSPSRIGAPTSPGGGLNRVLSMKDMKDVRRRTISSPPPRDLASVEDDDDITPNGSPTQTRRSSGADKPVKQSATDKDNRKIYVEDLDARQLALHLTVIEIVIFVQLRLHEIIGMKWMKNDGGPIVNKMTKRFNRVSYWVATEIVTAPTPKQRLAVLKKFIQTAKRLRELNSYNTLMEIIAGLNHSSVLRLKKLWESLPSQQMNEWKELDVLMSPDRNFKLYRKNLENVLYSTVNTGEAGDSSSNSESNADNTKNIVGLPYLAPILRDITFCYEGNPIYLNAENGDEQNKVINYELVLLLGKILAHLKRFQRMGLNWCTNLGVDMLCQNLILEGCSVPMSPRGDGSASPTSTKASEKEASSPVVGDRKGFTIGSFSSHGFDRNILECMIHIRAG
eukprot:TRINITY_DN1639_c0_g3_i1.p1 TRINITY_DN1639_c0_g3~~TRINITY_DN1639_c0_g3_i1.p1  ORF type:complete len:525 (-),score=55.58 TRINITY_DN1639_c0_g3_i1:129-1703(-)